MATVLTPIYCYRDRRTPAKEVDDAVLTQILESIPTEIYKPSWPAALFDLTAAVALTVISVLIFSHLPWFCIPIGWVSVASAMIFFFNIGHDCSHKTWTSSQLFNNIVGEISFLPLLHPYQPFRYKHTHSAKLLRQNLDNRKADVASHAPSLVAQLGLKGFFLEHYSTQGIPDVFRARALFSIVLSLTFNVVFFGTLVYYQGVMGPVVYWLVPLVLYKDVFYFKWLEFARRYTDIHFPTLIARSVPSYNLRLITQCIKEAQSSGDKVKEQEQLVMHEEALRQKEGDKKEGYDHHYGPEVEAKSYTDLADFVKHINVINSIILVGAPIAGIYGMLTVPLVWQTALFSVIYYFYTGLGITAGYHRLWAHRSYSASFPVSFFLMLAGSGALEGSIKWWCGGHRVHHRYTDTPKDPYNAKYGFWWAHMGWMLMNQKSAEKVKADIRDLRASRMVNLQHKYYGIVGPFMAFVFPTLVAGFFWGDYAGGYFYAGVCRLLFVHHSTFCVNSLAHWLGTHTYDDDRTPRDHILTAFVTLGEGYHNFHHEFPNDYRNGIRFYDYDPTKWLIKSLSLFGLTYNLKEFPANEVMKGKLLMKQKQLDREKAKLIFPGPTQSLAPMTWEDIKRKVREGVSLSVVDGLVHDLSNFVEEHPGGIDLIRSVVGRDGTRAFNGLTGVYKHSNAARHLLTTFRVGRLVEGGKVDADEGEGSKPKDE